MQNKLNKISKYQNTIKTISTKGLIIIPFRDSADGERKKQLDQLTVFLDTNIDKNKLEYNIIIQKDSKPFNRGLLLNKGFLENKNFDYYIYHDADLIPDEKLLREYYKYPETPVHLGYRGQRWSEIAEGSNKKFIGGVLSMNKYDIYLVNGYPNGFEGWGKEDDALSYRIKLNGLVVVHPPEGSVIDLEKLTIKEKLDQLKIIGKNMLGREQLEKDKTNWFNDGIKQLENSYKDKNKE